MSFFQIIRKALGTDAKIAELSKRMEMAEAERSVDDVEEIRQTRVDYDSETLVGSGGPLDSALRKDDTDALELIEAETVYKFTSGQFGADGDFFCGNGYHRNSKVEGDFTTGDGNFNEPAQPALADYSDVGS